MNTKEQQLAEFKARHKKLQQKAEEVQEVKEIAPVAQVIPTVAVEETLPPALPSSGLFLDRNELLTKDSILKNLAPEAKKYESLELTSEETSKIKTFLGRMKTGASAAVPMICRGSSCSYKEKCLEENTLVLTATGTKKIKQLVEGDKIYSFNDEHLLEKDIVSAVKYSGTKECITIETENGNRITSTLDHRFKIYDTEKENYKWEQLGTIIENSGTYLLLSIEPDESLNSESVGDFFLDPIKNIGKLEEKHVYDISVRNNNNFIANNLAVHNCEFYQMDKIRVGEDCLLEENLIDFWTSKYIDEFEIDLNSITELHTISRLVEITIKEMRLNMYLSIKEQDLLQDFVTSVDEAGNEIVNKGVSSVHTMREQLDARKFKIFESLNATREKKAKLQLGAMQTVQESQGLASMRTLLENLAKQVKEKGKVINHE